MLGVITIEIKMIIKPQKVQAIALRSNSTITLLGGAKGGGKSYALLLAPLYHVHLKDYHAVIFRRSLPQCKKSGGLWDKSFELYGALNGEPSYSALKWFFPSGATIQFSHLQKDNSYRDWFGTTVSFFGFDQLEEFTLDHFTNIISCMRTVAGVKTRIIATMNPEPNSWVRTLVEPWLALDGYVDLQKNNTDFYFNFTNGINWSSTNTGDRFSIKYVSADIYDNAILLKNDPEYLSHLKALSLIERERYLGIKGRGGNWNIKLAGNIFKYSWIYLSEYAYDVSDHVCRFWDFAYTTDYTATCLMAKKGDRYYVLEIRRFRLTVEATDRELLNQAIADSKKYRNYMVRWQKDPGSAGIRESSYLKVLLKEFNASYVNERRDKLSRSLDASRYLEKGAIAFVNADQEFMAELTSFPDSRHDDMVDAFTGAFNVLNSQSFSISTYSY